MLDVFFGKSITLREVVVTFVCGVYTDMAVAWFASHAIVQFLKHSAGLL